MGAVASFLPAFFYTQLIYKPKYPNGDLTGQTIVVTGSNVGLGFDAAQHFVRLNASRVILAVRDESKGEDAKKRILKALAADQSRLEVWPLDLSSTASVTAFVDRANRLDRLDAIVQNAGVLTTNWKTVEGGIESQVKVNLISTVLLALYLLPKLRETGKLYKKDTDLVLVGTNLRMIAAFREKDIKGEKLFDIFHSKEDANNSDRYPATKVLLMLACRELAERRPVSEASPVIINYCNPGMCNTSIFRDEVGRFIRKSIDIALNILARTSEVGSRTLVNCVTLLGRESHGKYVSNDRPKSAPYVENEWGRQIQKQFWSELMEELEELAPGISRNA